MFESLGRLKGRVAVITGGGQGVGAGIAQAYAREGAKVVITGRTLSKLESMAEVIRSEGGEVICLEALSGDRKHAEQTIDAAVSKWGRIDILVNNAHTFTAPMPMEDPKLEEDILVHVNSSVIGYLQLMQAAFPHMRKQGNGSIINMGSNYSIRCEPGYVHYAIAKEGVRTLTKTAAKEWGKYKIRVNTILPSAMSPKTVEYFNDNPAAREEEESRVALGILGTPDDIGPMAIFLGSDEGWYITGQTIGVDGGSIML